MIGGGVDGGAGSPVLADVWLGGRLGLEGLQIALTAGRVFSRRPLRHFLPALQLVLAHHCLVGNRLGQDDVRVPGEGRDLDHLDASPFKGGDPRDRAVIVEEQHGELARQQVDVFDFLVARMQVRLHVRVWQHEVDDAIELGPGRVQNLWMSASRRGRGATKAVTDFFRSELRQFDRWHVPILPREVTRCHGAPAAVIVADHAYTA